MNVYGLHLGLKYINMSKIVNHALNVFYFIKIENLIKENDPFLLKSFLEMKSNLSFAIYSLHIKIK